MSILFSFVVSISFAVSASKHRFPFTKEDNADGSRFVWFMYHQAGFTYEYEAAKSFPKSKRFEPSPGNIPQQGDIAWWKEFMAIYAGNVADGKDLMTAQKKLSHKELEKRYGPVKWFRFSKENPRKDTLKMFAATLSFINPNPSFWVENAREFDKSRNKGMLMFKRETIVDSEGLEIKPVISIVYEKLPSSITTVSDYARIARARTSFNVEKIESSKDSLLYYCNYASDLEHKLLIAHMVFKDIGVQIIGDSTTSVYPIVEKDFIQFMQSIAFE